MIKHEVEKVKGPEAASNTRVDDGRPDAVIGQMSQIDWESHCRRHQQLLDRERAEATTCFFESKSHAKSNNHSYFYSISQISILHSQVFVVLLASPPMQQMLHSKHFSQSHTLLQSLGSICELRLCCQLLYIPNKNQPHTL